MNPVNVPPTDYGLYYNHTFMLHQELGVVEVTSSGGVLAIRKVGRRMDRIVARPETLECLWPINMSINMSRGALYIVRRPVRSARRSATLEHYYIAWQDRPNGTAITPSMIKKMNFPPDYPTLDRAMSTLEGNHDSSVAISRDIILTKGTKGYGVVCSGESAGTLVETSNGFCFEPTMEASPFAKRAAFKLQKEGFLCQ